MAVDPCCRPLRETAGPAREPLGDLRLHPLHTPGGSPPRPLRSSRPLPAPQRAVEAATLAADWLEGRDRAAAAAAPAASVELEQGCLLVGEPTGGQGLRLPLLHAELACVAASAGRHVLALLPRSEGDLEAEDELEELEAWVFTLHSAAAVVMTVMETLSRLGAIRSDLENAFSVSKTLLGVGVFASVYLADTTYKAVPAALKVAGEAGSEEDRALPSEMRLLVAAQGHPNVIGFLGLFRTEHLGRKPQWALAQQFCPGSDLVLHIAISGSLSERAAAELMSGPLSGIAHLHSRGIVHRDVTADNILIAEGGRAVLADFGLAVFRAELASARGPTGTPGYAAPEMLRAPFKYGNKVDVFAFGVTLVWALFAMLPFHRQSTDETINSTARCQVDAHSIPQFGQVSELARALVLSLLTKHPEQRASAAAALAHAWFGSPPAQGQCRPQRYAAAFGAAAMCTSAQDEYQRRCDDAPGWSEAWEQAEEMDHGSHSDTEWEQAWQISNVLVSDLGAHAEDWAQASQVSETTSRSEGTCEEPEDWAALPRRSRRLSSGGGSGGAVEPPRPRPGRSGRSSDLGAAGRRAQYPREERSGEAWGEGGVGAPEHLKEAEPPAPGAGGPAAKAARGGRGLPARAMRQAAKWMAPPASWRSVPRPGARRAVPQEPRHWRLTLWLVRGRPPEEAGGSEPGRGPKPAGAMTSPSGASSEGAEFYALIPGTVAEA